MGWKVIIAPSARADLEEIARYVARHNSDAAARVGYKLIARAESVAAFPEMRRGVPEYETAACLTPKAFILSGKYILPSPTRSASLSS